MTYVVGVDHEEVDGIGTDVDHSEAHTRTVPSATDRDDRG